MACAIMRSSKRYSKNSTNKDAQNWYTIAQHNHVPVHKDVFSLLQGLVECVGENFRSTFVRIVRNHG